MRHLLLLPFVTVAISFPTSAQQPAPQAVPVVTYAAKPKPVSETKDYVGRIEAVERVDIRARVTGYLEAVLYKEGEIVKKGQPLYRIEQGLFKAAVEQSQGTLDGTKASKKLTKVELDRANQMMASTFGTPQKRDQALELIRQRPARWVAACAWRYGVFWAGRASWWRAAPGHPLGGGALTAARGAAHGEILIEAQSGAIDGLPVVQACRALEILQSFDGSIGHLLLKRIVKPRCWLGRVEALGKLELRGRQDYAALVVIGVGHVAADERVVRIE